MAGVTRYEDLIVWQLSDQLQRAVFELTATGPASKDFKFRDQIREASSSATRNVAEGFGRLADAQFASFLRIARGSLMETHNCLGDGQGRGYFSAEDTARCQHIAIRAMKAAVGLINYLDPPDNHPRRPPMRRFPRTS